MQTIDFADIKVGRIIMMKECFPCKVVSVKVSKPGKHGSVKKNVTGIDILSDKKYVEIYNHNSIVKMPDVTKEIFIVVDIDNDGYLSLMNDDGDIREDIRVEGENKEKIQNDFENNEDDEIKLNIMIVKMNDVEKFKILFD